MRHLLRLFILLTFITTACSTPASPLATPQPATVTSTPPTDSQPSNEPSAYITFVINVHDWTHPSESADTLLRLVDLFEKYGVRGDFYFTAEVSRKYVEERPDVIERLKNSNMTISYHVRPPHLLYAGFDSRLDEGGSSIAAQQDAALYQTLLEYETYALDLETGDLDRSRSGGYTYVAQVFGRKPVVAPAPTSSARVKDAAQRVYASLGAQMTLLYHEAGTDPNQPFEYVDGLLVRPSDFGATRVTSINGSDNFWWNYMGKPGAEQYNPTSMLQSQLVEWESHNYGRAPFITAIVHENNFYRGGAEGWTAIYGSAVGYHYYAMENGKKTDPLPPPYDLSAPDLSRPRSAEEQAAVWAVYEELVAYAASNLRVVTSEDIVVMAKR